jgi:predicted phosphoribosyltransferase
MSEAELPFRDREAGGAALAPLLEQWRGREDVVVLGLPRGGVPVAAEVARALCAPLDVFLVRKLGVPGQEELAFGAIAGSGLRVLNQELVRALRLSGEAIDAITRREQSELARRDELFRQGMAPLDLRGRVAILVDDGLATGATMLAAVRAARAMEAARVIVAVPVAASEACRMLREEADEVVCAATPRDFRAVGAWYENFMQIADVEVRVILEEHERALGEDRL